LAGFVAVLEFLAPTDRPSTESVDKACNRLRFPEASIQGAIFSKWRLEEAKFGAEHMSDPREIKALITIYTVGYNMGFAHVWEAIDQDAHVEEVTYDPCFKVVAMVKPPLSPEKAAVIQSKCSEVARETRAKHGPVLKCLLASKEMNGELSGTANKFGCASR
jgi:hypothetical protein